MSVSLNCFILEGNPCKNTFVIDIDRNKKVYKLKEIIKEKNANTLANIDAFTLKLWKVNIPLYKKNDKIRIINTKTDFNVCFKLEGEVMTSLLNISDLFPNDDLKENHIHIIIKAISIGKKVIIKLVNMINLAWFNFDNRSFILIILTITISFFQGQKCLPVTVEKSYIWKNKTYIWKNS